MSTTLDLPVVTVAESGDLVYITRGVGADRDKTITVDDMVNGYLNRENDANGNDAYYGASVPADVNTFFVSSFGPGVFTNWWENTAGNESKGQFLGKNVYKNTSNNAVFLDDTRTAEYIEFNGTNGGTYAYQAPSNPGGNPSFSESWSLSPFGISCAGGYLKLANTGWSWGSSDPYNYDGKIDFGQTGGLASRNVTASKDTALYFNCYVDTSGNIKYKTDANGAGYLQITESQLRFWHDDTSRSASDTGSFVNLLQVNASTFNSASDYARFNSSNYSWDTANYSPLDLGDNCAIASNQANITSYFGNNLYKAAGVGWAYKNAADGATLLSIYEGGMDLFLDGTTRAAGALASLNSYLNITPTAFTSLPIYTATTGSAANVNIDAGGNLKRSTSSRKYKKNERELEMDTTKIYDVEIVTFDFKQDESTGHGPIAEDIAEVEANFASYDLEGDPDGINTHALIYSLVEEVKKLKARVDELEGANG
jgi:hypothetical protein